MPLCRVVFLDLILYQPRLIQNGFDVGVEGCEHVNNFVPVDCIDQDDFLQGGVVDAILDPRKVSQKLSAKAGHRAVTDRNCRVFWPVPLMLRLGLNLRT